MSAPAPTLTAPAARRNRPRPSPSRRRVIGLLSGLLLLLLAFVVSVCWGARVFSPAEAWSAVTAFTGSDMDVVVRDVRLPRTLLAILVGAGVSVAGCVMQAVTRNPLADPGILGVNAGAGLAVAVAIGVFGITNAGGYIWFAFAGALLVGGAVYGLSTIQDRGTIAGGALGLTMSGVALAAVLSGVTLALTRLWPDAFDQMRNWESGSLAGRDLSAVLLALPAVAAGIVVALALARQLDAVAMGDHIAVSMGVHPARVRVSAWGTVALLAGTAVAVAGPVGFVGLIVPHIVRRFTGPHERWLIPACALYGASLVLLSDVLGRSIIAPSEVPVGVVTGIIGGVALALIAYRKRISG